MAFTLLAMALSAATPPAAEPAKSAKDEPSVSVSESDPLAEPEPKRVVIGRDNVDLAGAGRLEFTPDAGPVIASLPSGPYLKVLASLGEGEIAFNSGGRAIACISGSTGMQGRAMEILCRQIEARARFRRNDGYALPYEVGRLAFSVKVRQVLAPRKPIALLPPGKGYDLTLVTTGKPGTAGCSILGNPFSAADSEAICQAWISAGRPGLGAAPAPPPVIRKRTGPPTAALATRRGLATAAVRPAPRPVVRPPAEIPSGGDLANVALQLGQPKQDLILEDRMIWRDVDIDYPPVPFDERPPIGTGNGTLGNTITSADYPRLALIEELEGRVKVLMGFARDGSPESCRPVGSSGTAYLDNVTCDVAMRRLRFAFSNRISDFSGLRYYVADIRWIVPID